MNGKEALRMLNNNRTLNKYINVYIKNKFTQPTDDKTKPQIKRRFGNGLKFVVRDIRRFIGYDVSSMLVVSSSWQFALDLQDVFKAAHMTYLCPDNLRETPLSLSEYDLSIIMLEGRYLQETEKVSENYERIFAASKVVAMQGHCGGTYSRKVVRYLTSKIYEEVTGQPDNYLDEDWMTARMGRFTRGKSEVYSYDRIMRTFKLN